MTMIREIVAELIGMFVAEKRLTIARQAPSEEVPFSGRWALRVPR